MYRLTGSICCALIGLHFLTASAVASKRYFGRVSAFVVDKSGKSLGGKKMYTVTLDVDTAAKKGEATSFYYEIHKFWGENESESANIQGVVKDNSDGLFKVTFSGGAYLEDTQRVMDRLRTRREGSGPPEKVLKASGELGCTVCTNGDLNMYKTKYVQSSSGGVATEKRTLVKGTLHPILFLPPTAKTESKAKGKSKRHSGEKK